MNVSAPGRRHPNLTVVLEPKVSVPVVKSNAMS
jgi:hypothetical protein